MMLPQLQARVFIARIGLYAEAYPGLTHSRNQAHFQPNAGMFTVHLKKYQAQAYLFSQLGLNLIKAQLIVNNKKNDNYPCTNPQVVGIQEKIILLTNPLLLSLV